MKTEFDATKMVEEIAMRSKENQEEFIFETIQPYCENILQMKINKNELEQMLLKCSRLEDFIKHKIDYLEELASIENNEGRWIEAEKYYYASSVLEEVVEYINTSRGGEDGKDKDNN